MASKHQLSLEIQQTSNCTVFRVFDTSIYSPDLQVDCGILQIIPPGFNQAITIETEKDFNFLITACMIGLQNKDCGDQAYYLPDGVYNIKYSVSPNDKVYVEYNYLRTCQVLNRYYLELCKLELAACEPEADVKAQVQELQLIKGYIDAAKAKVEQCQDLHKGVELLLYAKERLDRVGRNGWCGSDSCG